MTWERNVIAPKVTSWTSWKLGSKCVVLPPSFPQPPPPPNSFHPACFSCGWGEVVRGKKASTQEEHAASLGKKTPSPSSVLNLYVLLPVVLLVLLWRKETNKSSLAAIMKTASRVGQQEEEPCFELTEMCVLFCCNTPNFNLFLSDQTHIVHVKSPSDKTFPAADCGRLPHMNCSASFTCNCGSFATFHHCSSSSCWISRHKSAVTQANQ